MLTSRHYGSGFIKARARVLVNGTPESPIPDFPKWVISRHVASLNRSVQIYPRISTMESPDLLSSGLLISRFLISRNGKSHDTWPPSFRRSRSISGILPLFTGVLTLRYLLTDPTTVGFSSRDLTAQTVPN
jgi:hypothetical protein